jgi:nitrite reductase (NO-forming)
MKFPDSRKRGISTSGAVAALIVVVLILFGLAYMSIGSLDSRMRSLESNWTKYQSQTSSQQTSSTSSQQTTQTIQPTTRHITLIAEETKVEIANNVYYDAWTFNGTVPGPSIFVNQGDTIVFKLINNMTNMKHSIDFHAAEVDWSTDYASIGPGETKAFNFTVNYPGVFMYHCGTPPVLEHISNGMYGAIIVRPSVPLPQASGGEYVFVQSEFYLNSKPGPDGAYSGNYTKMLNGNPDYVVFNGRAFQYQANPLHVKPNQLVRLYVLNVGPNHWSAFHVIGAIMDTVYIDGDPLNVMHGLQTLNLPPSGGAILDMYFRDPGGKNPFVTHDFADASKGAVGVFVVESNSSGSTTTSTRTSSSASSAKVVIVPGAASNTQSPGYSPATITVVIGVNNTVVWINNDNAPHTVTSTTGAFDSGNMNAGDTFTFTFTSPGMYQYFCSYHPWMKGTVVVKQG